MFKDPKNRWRRGLCRYCVQPIVPSYIVCERHLAISRRNKVGTDRFHWTELDDLVLLWCAYYRCEWAKIVALFPQRTATGVRRRLDRLLARRPPANTRGRPRPRPRIRLKPYPTKNRIATDPSTS